MGYCGVDAPSTMDPLPLPTPQDRAPRGPAPRLSGAPDFPQGDRKLVPLAGGRIQVEAFPWTGGLCLWTQNEEGRWVRVSLQR